MEFVLYAVKIMRRTQREIFDPGQSAPAILRTMLFEKPTAPSHASSRWHIGNVEAIDDTGVYFALGRTSRSTLSVLVEGTGDFADQLYDNAPYTHAFIDVRREVCAIATKSDLAPDTDAMARQLAKLLQSCRIAKELRVDVSVSPVHEPEQLLAALRDAYAITSFTVHFTRPNPIDVNDEFLRPMERLALAAGGEAGQTTIRGASLDADPLTDLVRSAAASGDNAVARIKQEPGKKSVRRSLRGQNARVDEEDVSTPEGRAKILGKLRRKHSSVRGRDGGGSA